MKCVCMHALHSVVVVNNPLETVCEWSFHAIQWPVHLIEFNSFHFIHMIRMGIFDLIFLSDVGQMRIFIDFHTFQFHVCTQSYIQLEKKEKFSNMNDRSTYSHIHISVLVQNRIESKSTKNYFRLNTTESVIFKWQNLEFSTVELESVVRFLLNGFRIMRWIIVIWRMKLKKWQLVDRYIRCIYFLSCPEIWMSCNLHSNWKKSRSACIR